MMVLIGGINLTEHKPALKMNGFISINVDVASNPFCQNMMMADTICKKCYARYMASRYPRLKKALIHNYQALSTGLLSADQIEKIGNFVLKRGIGLRFNSMGELINDTHALNLNMIAMYIKSKKPDYPITVWSKRFAMAGLLDGNYMIKIFSNPLIDSPVTHIPSGFNGVFNVNTYVYFQNNNFKPNCSGKCRECMKCYTPGNSGFIIHELIKSDQNKIKKGILNVI